MVGPVNFEKDAEYWQQDRWSGLFPVKWHIIKDVPNSLFRHILLENNENKPVTHSRDTQEVTVDSFIVYLFFLERFICLTKFTLIIYYLFILSRRGHMPKHDYLL